MSIKLTPDMLPFVGKTRDGRKAFVNGYNDFRDNTFPFYGHIENGIGYCCWSSDGMFVAYCGENIADIVSEWKEPVKHKAWVVFIESDNGNDVLSRTFLSKQELDRCLNGYKINNVKVIGIAETNEITEEV